MKSEKAVFPRKFQAAQDEETLRRVLFARVQKIREKGELVVPLLTVTSALASALNAAERRGHLRIGLDAAEEILARERHGLQKMEKEQGLFVGKRISRLILTAMMVQSAFTGASNGWPGITAPGCWSVGLTSPHRNSAASFSVRSEISNCS
jgi:hypothetical protein